MSATTVRLTVLTGPHKGSRFCYRQTDAVTLGRANDCEICLHGNVSDLKVSRHHCRLQLGADAIHVEDLASRNGTFVNGHPVDPNAMPDVLDSGDVLTVGDTTFEVQLFACPLNQSNEPAPHWPQGQPVYKNCPRDC